MRIAFVISSLTCGGAERVMSILVNHYSERGDEVSLLTLAGNERDFYPIDRRVNRISLDLLKDSENTIDAIRNNAARITGLRRALRNVGPDVVISFMHRTNIVTLLAAFGLSIPVIVSERIDTRQWPIGYAWEKLRRYLYPYANAVVVQTESMRQWATEFITDNHVFTIPNPVVYENVNTDPVWPIKQRIDSPFVVAMGRLVEQKGFDMLLEAFSRCLDRQWSLVILGEGAEHDRLVLQAKALGIDGRTHFVGNVRCPASILARASIFVLSSRFEGFPNALVEAMSLCLPVISFNCPSGPSEIIDDGVNGLLVPANDIQGLSVMLSRLMRDESMRLRLGQQAGNVIERFSLSRVIEQWDRLIMPR